MGECLGIPVNIRVAWKCFWRRVFTKHKPFTTNL